MHRVSIWKLDSGGKSLFCADCFDRDSDGHTQGTRLPRDEHAALFAPLEAAQIIRVADVAEVPSLASLHMHYLTPTGCRALLVTPVTRGSEPGAWLWFEDDSGLDHWPNDTVRLAQAHWLDISACPVCQPSCRAIVQRKTWSALPASAHSSAGPYWSFWSIRRHLPTPNC